MINLTEVDRLVSSEIDIAALRSDVEKYVTTYAIEYSNRAAEEFTKEAKDVISIAYYDQYSPDYYDRTDDLRNNSYYKYKKKKGDTYYGGVIISSRDMSDYINSWSVLGNTTITPAANVVEWAWGEGYHGYKNGNPGNPIYTSPPPLFVLWNKLQIKAQELQDEAESIAKSQSYAVLKF